MSYPLLHNCPVCGAGLRVTRLDCPECKTCIEGDFEPERLLSLNNTQRDFVVSFLRNRGNIREMEKELGISYPTVRARLDEIITALDGLPRAKPAPAPPKPTRKEILEQLARGEIAQDEAMRLLNVK